jgi:hypothetical protein
VSKVALIQMLPPEFTIESTDLISTEGQLSG